MRAHCGLPGQLQLLHLSQHCIIHIQQALVPSSVCQKLVRIIQTQSELPRIYLSLKRAVLLTAVGVYFVLVAVFTVQLDLPVFHPHHIY